MFLRKITFLLLFLISFSSQAQFLSAQIGIDGLTCSMCSNSTEKSIRKLDFVKDVKMDLNKNIADIEFQPGKEVSIEALAQKVEEAGFSVRFIEAVFNFEPVKITDNYCFSYGNSAYRFLKVDEKLLAEKVKLKFLGEKYQGKKLYKNWKAQLNKSNKEPSCDPAKKQYFVTL